MNRGELVTFMLVPHMVKLISAQLEVFTSAISWPIPTCHVMRSFVCKDLNPNWLELFSSPVMGMCWISLWISNITPPPWRFLSFLYTLYGQVSGNNSEVAIELLIFVSWMAKTWGWWKSRKANSSRFLPLMLLIFMLINFSPLTKLFLFVPFEEDLVFFFFCQSGSGSG